MKYLKAPVPVAAFLAGLAPLAAAAQSFDYKEPELQIEIPNVVFSKVTTKTTGDVTTLTIPFIADYIGGLYNYLIFTAAVIAGVMSVMGGFQYLTAGGDAGKVKAAKERITNAIAGVILTLGAYTILNTVSPSLIKLKGLQINSVKVIPFKMVEKVDMSDNPNPNVPPDLVKNIEGENSIGSKGTAYCKSPEDCAEKCKDPSKWPKGPPFALTEEQALAIPDGTGLSGNGERASKAMIDKLTKAGLEADKAGFVIVVESGWRSLKRQMEIVCANYVGSKEKEKKIGHSVPWPGGSTHGRGTAVAVSMKDKATGETVLSAGDCAAQESGNAATEDISKKLNDFMFAAGFTRYQNAIWEFKSETAVCQCVTGGKPCPKYPPSCTRGCN